MRLDDVDADAGGIEDRRGRGGGGGGLGGIPLGRGGKIGAPVVLVVLVLVAKVLLGGGGGDGGSGGVDIGSVLGELGGSAQSDTAPAAPADNRDAQIRFVAQVKNLLGDYWGDAFRRSSIDFREPGVVVFDSPTPTGCGLGEPEAGPFYCPADQKIYIDLGFYQQLERQLGFDGDFAEAYVLAHEYGHHVQNLLGVSDQVEQAGGGNELSVKLELQADCFAGVWARSAYEDRRQLLEEGDLDEALRAASAVGDDAIQRRTQGRVDRDSFTHGSSEQRQRWFRTGFDSGDPERCDTFA